jgi:nucleoside-diphosphate-sugar epimerase
MIQSKKILVTGATGQVARPIAESLAKHNEVWCIARFSEPALKAQVEALGIKTWAWTLTGSQVTSARHRQVLGVEKAAARGAHGNEAVHGDQRRGHRTLIVRFVPAWIVEAVAVLELAA